MRHSQRSQTMRRIVAIGGGSFDSMPPLLQQVVDLCETGTPIITVIPTAAGTPEGERESYEQWRDMFSQFTPRIRPLFLLTNSPTRAEVREVLETTDAVWVPGGNTRFMLREWRRVSLDQEVRRASRRGTVMSGRSAGANCWFSYSLGAEPPQATARFFTYRRNRGVGLVDSSLFCHYEKRREPSRAFLLTFGGTGVGLGDCVALTIRGERFSVASSGKDKAYAVSIAEGTRSLSETVLRSDGRWRPLADLGIES
jgi:dipeptidase E